jgi:arylsulfatase A-like enzyme
VIVAWHWDDAKNAFGVAGRQLIPGRPGAAHNGHGSLNPYTTHTVLIAVGKDFKQGQTIDVPAGNVDLTPTLLAIEGLPVPASMEGRKLTGPQPKSSTRRIQARSGQYCGELEISYAGDHAYLNQANRCRQ